MLRQTSSSARMPFVFLACFATSALRGRRGEEVCQHATEHDEDGVCGEGRREGCCRCTYRANAFGRASGGRRKGRARAAEREGGGEGGGRAAGRGDGHRFRATLAKAAASVPRAAFPRATRLPCFPFVLKSLLGNLVGTPPRLLGLPLALPDRARAG